MRRLLSLLRTTLAAVGLAALLICFTPLPERMVEPLVVDQPATGAETVVVFSSGFHDSGLGDHGTVNRLQSGLALFRSLGAHTIVCLGGIRLEDGRTYSEAMRDQLVLWGVPAAQIETVPEGGNTYLDLLAMQEAHLPAMESGKVAFVTSAYHTRRVRMLLDKQGIEGVVVSAEPCELAPASWPERLTVFRNAAREYMALVYSRIAGWL